MAATGPSLTREVAEACKGQRVIAVSDAYRLLPFADALYSCDARWWDAHNGVPGFKGEKWSCHGSDTYNNKIPTAEKYGLKLVAGESGEGFSFEPSLIHYGSNSGFQAINLALQFGCKRVVLVGFDMRIVPTKEGESAAKAMRHFFGDHPSGLSNCADYGKFIPAFKEAARKLPEGIEIINCTPGSALTCFKMAALADALPCQA